MTVLEQLELKVGDLLICHDDPPGGSSFGVVTAVDVYIADVNANGFRVFWPECQCGLKFEPSVETEYVYSGVRTYFEKCS